MFDRKVRTQKLSIKLEFEVPAVCPEVAEEMAASWIRDALPKSLKGTAMASGLKITEIEIPNAKPNGGNT